LSKKRATFSLTFSCGKKPSSGTILLSSAKGSVYGNENLGGGGKWNRFSYFCAAGRWVIEGAPRHPHKKKKVKGGTLSADKGLEGHPRNLNGGTKAISDQKGKVRGRANRFRAKPSEEGEKKDRPEHCAGMGSR